MKKPVSNKPGPLSTSTSLEAPSQRELVKKKFLENMGRSNIITASADNAGVSPQTISAWVREGYITPDELEGALKAYHDMIRGEIAKRTFIGVSKPLIQNGRVVYDREGKQVSVNTLDNRMLLLLAQKVLPEWKEEKQTIIVQNNDGIPDEYRVVFDVRSMSREQFARLKDLALEIENNGVTVNAD